MRGGRGFALFCSRGGWTWAPREVSHVRKCRQEVRGCKFNSPLRICKFYLHLAAWDACGKDNEETGDEPGQTRGP